MSDAPNNALALPFYGTEVILTARIGPEAGKVYASIDGAPVPSLPRDERGSFLTLQSSTQTVDRALVLAQGLAYQQHHLDLRTAGAGTVALSEIRITAESPFPWAFSMLEFALAAGVFLSLRTLARSLPGHLSAARSRGRR